MQNKFFDEEEGNALAQEQRAHKPADLWDITFYTRWFWGPELSFIDCTRRSKFLTHALSEYGIYGLLSILSDL